MPMFFCSMTSWLRPCRSIWPSDPANERLVNREQARYLSPTRPLPSFIQTHEREMARRRGILLLTLFVGCPQILAAEEDCVKADYGTVCLDPVENDKDRSVTISAHNRETYEVTITLNAKLKNMTSSVKLPYTRALDGGFRQPILKFVANPQGDWEWEYSWNWILGSLNARHD